MPTLTKSMQILELLPGLEAAALATVRLLNESRQALGMPAAVLRIPGLRRTEIHLAAAERVRRQQARKQRIEKERACLQEKKLRALEKKYPPAGPTQKKTLVKRKQGNPAPFETIL